MSSQAISHAQRATRLYRRALKNTLSWYIDRALWREQALKLRARFDANKHLRDRRAIQALLEAGEEELQKEIHPDPYLAPTAPDGTLWERNPPLPSEIMQMTPDEKQWFEEYVKFHNGPNIKIGDPSTVPFPKYVWSPAGGWHCNPPNWKRNTCLAMLAVVASSGVVWYISAQLERRPVPPYRLIPSQMWCKYAAVDDPRLRSEDELADMAMDKAPSFVSVPGKWPRSYERVPDLNNVDPQDMVAVTKAREQRVRDRAVHREELNILRKRVSDCQRREEVNHLQRCRQHYMAYMKSFRKYHSEGWLSKH